MSGLQSRETKSKATEEHWVLADNSKYVLYSPGSNTNCIRMSSTFGDGQVISLYTGSFAQIKETELNFCDSICGGASFNRPRVVLYFCLSGEFALEEEELTVNTTQFLAFNARDLRQVKFQPNLRYKIITVEFDPAKVGGISGNYFQGKSTAFATYQLSPALKTVLHQLIHCPYQQSVKRIYMEGKLLELLAIYLNETVEQRGRTVNDGTNLSRQDVTSIVQARQILDRNFISPPTLAVLAKQICLNEFKLKIGFKQLFGQTVHAYIVDKRLELARQLLEEKKLKAGEAASFIGYSNASYFALAFRKKFGVSPSEYLNR
ncbi:helix-turn-helix transcriptional regulator|uniref:AraC-type DNA-binding protein n=2 Tax=Dendrosporobacter quercicolus TaxID=146817 RepID=A0A1G9RSI6_9FIRM|nr:helix-turn-helix transcriptional regulator [Dendrosporobacter quercicolus DSM 1736]SDM26176.1 AraC-type DNA-binding protein [Dendrosporobacter quercicolus]